MSVYVDNWNQKARVGRLNTNWCHLYADTREELMSFALSIGLRASWKQNWDRNSFHFDVVPSRRLAAVRAGAIETSWRHFGELMLARGRGN